MAAEIRAEMGRQDRSRRWLADQIGESHVTVGRWVKGETPMSLDILDAICRALGLTIADLLSSVERNGGYEPVTTLPRRAHAVEGADAASPHEVSSRSNRGYVSGEPGYIFEGNVVQDPFPAVEKTAADLFLAVA